MVCHWHRYRAVLDFFLRELKWGTPIDCRGVLAGKLYQIERHVSTVDFLPRRTCLTTTYNRIAVAVTTCFTHYYCLHLKSLKSQSF